MHASRRRFAQPTRAAPIRLCADALLAGAPLGGRRARSHPIGTALLTGVPTGIVKSGFYTRMTPVTWWDYPFWATAAVLVGLTAATYVRAGRPTVLPAPDRTKRTLGATLLSVFAVGCPICNKLVVAVLGVSGALTYFAPLQPLLGALSVALLAAGLAVRLRWAVACPTQNRPTT